MYSYSQRLPPQFTPNNLSILRRTKESSGERVLDLTLSNPVSAGLEYPHGALRTIFGSLADYSYNPDPFGAIAARLTVASYYARQGVTIRPEQIALTASTSEAYGVLMKLLCDPGDEILVPAPSYPLFDDLAALESVRAVPYRLLYAGGWFIDFAHLECAMSDRTRALVLVNPNNPTGSFLKAGELAMMSELAIGRGVPVICDEVFADYVLELAPDAVTSLARVEQAGLTFVLNGLSKVAGMPQLKLSWIAIQGPAANRVEAIERLEHILDTYLSVATPVQRVLDQVLAAGLILQEQIMTRVRANLKHLRSSLEGTPVELLRTEAGWSAILRLPATRSEEYWVTTLLDAHNVAVQPGYFFDMASEPYVVVSLLTPPDDLQSGTSALLRMISEG